MVQDPAAKARTPQGSKGREEPPQWPRCPPAESRSWHRGCNTDSAAVRGGLKVLHPGRLPVITPVGSHRGSRSSLNTYKVSKYDELFTSLCIAQLLLQGKVQWQRLWQARKDSHCRVAGITGKAHSTLHLVCHELQSSPAPSQSIF